MAHAEIYLHGGIFNPPHNQRFNTAAIGLSFDELKRQLNEQGIKVIPSEDAKGGSDFLVDAVRVS